MPSHNFSYYLDVQRLIPLIYLRFQTIPSLVFPAVFVVRILLVTVSLSSDFPQVWSVYFLIDSSAVRMCTLCVLPLLIIVKALKVDSLHSAASALKKINYLRLPHQTHCEVSCVTSSSLIPCLTFFLWGDDDISAFDCHNTLAFKKLRNLESPSRESFLSH